MVDLDFGETIGGGGDVQMAVGNKKAGQLNVDRLD